MEITVKTGIVRSALVAISFIANGIWRAIKRFFTFIAHVAILWGIASLLALKLANIFMCLGTVLLAYMVLEFMTKRSFDSKWKKKG